MSEKLGKHPCCEVVPLRLRRKMRSPLPPRLEMPRVPIRDRTSHHRALCPRRLLRGIWYRKSSHIANCHPHQRAQLIKASGSDSLVRVLPRLPKATQLALQPLHGRHPQAHLSQISAKKARQEQWEHARDKHGFANTAAWAKQQHSTSNKSLASRNKHITRRRAAGLAASLQVKVITNPAGHDLDSFFRPSWSRARGTHTHTHNMPCLGVQTLWPAGLQQPQSIPPPHHQSMCMVF